MLIECNVAWDVVYVQRLGGVHLLETPYVDLMWPLLEESGTGNSAVGARP